MTNDLAAEKRDQMSRCRRTTPTAAAARTRTEGRAGDDGNDARQAGGGQAADAQRGGGAGWRRRGRMAKEREWVNHTLCHRHEACVDMGDENFHLLDLLAD